MPSTGSQSGGGSKHGYMIMNHKHDTRRYQCPTAYMLSLLGVPETPAYCVNREKLPRGVKLRAETSRRERFRQTEGISSGEIVRQG